MDEQQSESSTETPEKRAFAHRRSRKSVVGKIEDAQWAIEQELSKTDSRPARCNLLQARLESLMVLLKREDEQKHDATMQENAALKLKCEADAQRIAELESENRALTIKTGVKLQIDPDAEKRRQENKALRDAVKTILAKTGVEDRARLAVRNASSLKEIWDLLELPFDYQTCGQLLADQNYRTEKSLLELVQRCPAGSQFSVFAKAALAEKFNTVIAPKEPEAEVLTVEEKLAEVKARLAKARREADERMRADEAEKFRRETLAGPRGLGGSDRGVAVEWRNVQTVPSPIKREPVGSPFAEWV